MKIIKIHTFSKLLEMLPIQTESFSFLAGGTDIMPAVNRNNYQKEIVYDISHFKKEMDYITISKNSVEIGALVTLSTILKSKMIEENIPQLTKAINSMASVQIRNMATLVGNIANASPVADSSPVLLTIDTVINAVSTQGLRQIPIDKFFVDYKHTTLRKNELILSITIPFNDPQKKYDFVKVATRPDTAISKVNFAYALGNNYARFAAGGVAKVPTRLPNVEKHFFDVKLTQDNFVNLVDQDVTPIDDVRSTAEYRKTVLAYLIWEVYKKIVPQRF